jgi:hypothetical protein
MMPWIWKNKLVDKENNLYRVWRVK